MGNNYSNGIISKPNISAGNPYGVNRTFIARIANNEKFGTVQIPMLNQQQGLEMLSPDNLFQTSNATNIEENSYYIDYASQVIFFNPKQIGQKIVFAAYDMGEDLISDRKICTLVDNNGNPIETLKDIIDKGFEAIDYLNTIGSAIEITDLLKAEIENGKNMADNLQEKIVVGGNTITLLTNITNEAKDTNIILSATNDNAKTTDSTLKSTISSANTKDGELKSTITSAESKRVEMVDTTANANSSKTQLQTVINDSVSKKTQLQTTIDDSVVKNNILQASIGSADIGGMKGDIINLQTNKLNKNDLITELKKVDGVGSGLDSDLFRGLGLENFFKISDTIDESSKLTVTSGLQKIGWLDNYIFRNGLTKKVEFCISLQHVTGLDSLGTNTVLGTLDSAIRPRKDALIPCTMIRQDEGLNSVGYVRINSDGRILVHRGLSGGNANFTGITVQGQFYIN